MEYWLWQRIETVQLCAPTNSCTGSGSTDVISGFLNCSGADETELMSIASRISNLIHLSHLPRISRLS